ncbi:MAG: SIP domain-containing protein [Neisseria sp.]|uniref:siderophore-interacting protein n=1 Tax=Neisseria sp. TaxID=192066 RepID=UPI0026DB2202|nr:siderophore-interacting protein [Neisseria sp.]MDO4641754.1 SIP domain-containing protein [Neisseria sp.]
MKAQRTPINDIEQKTDIIEHINENHPEAVLNLALAYSSEQPKSARLLDIFKEGCLLESLNAEQKTQECFIPFLLESDNIGEQMRYLIFDAAARQGKPIGSGKIQYFTVLATKKASLHMQRLILQSALPIPENEPGYAWYFNLKTHAKLPDNPKQVHLSETEKAQQQALIQQARNVSAEQRWQLLDKLFEGMRYYTLRSSSKSRPDLTFNDTAVVDVFLHGQTEGSLWAENLKPGDIIRSNTDFHESTGHLHSGQAILIGDETALPTVAALLENWQNPCPPIVFSITTDAADQAYLPDSLLPSGSVLHRISGSANIAEELIGRLKTLPEINAAWGALEAQAAANVRKYLRNEVGLDSKTCRIKGYWRKAETK